VLFGDVSGVASTFNDDNEWLLGSQRAGQHLRLHWPWVD